MPNFKKNHEQNAAEVCVCCNDKTTKGKTFTTELQDVFLRLCPNYHQIKQFLPSVICNGCKTKLSSQGKAYQRELPKPAKYGELAAVVKGISDDMKSRHSKVPENCLSDEIRKSTTCPCPICLVARWNGRNGVYPLSPFAPDAPAPPPQGGRPRQTPAPPPAGKIVLCDVCKARLGPGLPHDCKPHLQADNLLKITSPTTAEKMASSVAKKVTDEGRSAMKAKRGLFKFTPGEEKPDNQGFISHKTMDTIQSVMNASGSAMLKMGQVLRADATNVKIEENYAAHMYRRNKALKDLFKYEHYRFYDKGTDGTYTINPKHFVYTRNINELVKTIIDERGLTGLPIIAKFGIDSGSSEGHSSCKIGMILCVDPDADLNSPVKKKDKTINVLKPFSDEGVKKMIIVGIGVNVDELYENIRDMMRAIGIEKFDVHFCCDLKMINIKAGIQSHGARFSCAFCWTDGLGKKDKQGNWIIPKWHEVQPLRKFGEIRRYAAAFQASKKPRSALPDYKNCEFEPLIEADDQEYVIVRMPPPQMHILSGNANQILDGLRERIRTSPDPSFEANLDKWLDKKGIYDDKHGKHRGLIGTEANKLCLAAPELVKFLPIQYKMFGNALVCLRDVVDYCMGKMLIDGYLKKISEYKLAFRKLQILMSVKVHILVDDVPRYIRLLSKKPLGHDTEQPFEGLHQEYGKTWKNYKVYSTNNPKFGEHFLDSVVQFNSTHI